MKYTQKKFSVAVAAGHLSDEEYLVRVGAITQAEFDQRQKRKTLPRHVKALVDQGSRISQIQVHQAIDEILAAGPEEVGK